MKEISILVTKDPLKNTLPFEMKPKDYGYKVDYGYKSSDLYYISCASHQICSFSDTEIHKAGLSHVLLFNYS